MTTNTGVSATTAQTTALSSLSSSLSSTTSSPSTSSITSRLTSTTGEPGDRDGDDMVIMIGIPVAAVLVITIIIALVIIKRKRSVPNTQNMPPGRSDLVPEDLIDQVEDPEPIIKSRWALKPEERNPPKNITPEKRVPVAQERRDSCCSGSSYIEPPNYITNSIQKNKNVDRKESVYMEMKGAEKLPAPCVGSGGKGYVNVDDDQGIYANDNNVDCTSDEQSANESHADNTGDLVYVNTAFDDSDYVNSPEKRF